jgi:hypothetical protein
VLIAPCGGSSGLPKVPARAVAAAAATPPAAVAARKLRRDGTKLSVMAVPCSSSPMIAEACISGGERTECRPVESAHDARHHRRKAIVDEV